MISASDIEETQEVLIKTDVVEIKSEAEEAGGNVTSENSIPNSNLEENPIETVQDRPDMVQTTDMGQRPDTGHRPDMINQAICKHCLATFTDPFGRAKLSHHLMTFHFNHPPEIHMASPQSNMPTPSGTPGIPELVGQNRQTNTLTPSTPPEILFQYPIPSVPDMGQRTIVSQQTLPQPLTHNDVVDHYMERLRFQQTMQPMHSGAQQVNEEYDISIFTNLNITKGQ
jgi:hypothetical protein